MELFDNAASPYAIKVRILLYEKGIEFEKHEIWHHSQRRELLQLSPRGEVPALRDGDVEIYDSRLICDYLEEGYPDPSLLPVSAAERARCRRLELLSDGAIDACVYILGMGKLFRPELLETHPGAIDRAARMLLRYHDELDSELDGRDFFCGDFSRADLSLSPHLASAAFMGWRVERAKHPRLRDWVERMRVRPSVARAMGEYGAAYRRSRTDEDPMFGNDRLHWRTDRIECALQCGLGEWLLAELEADRAFLSPPPS